MTILLFLLATSIALTNVAAGPQYESCIEKKFKCHKLVPGAIAKAPATKVNVKYGDCDFVEAGNTLTPTQTKEAPEVCWKAEDCKLYTLIFVDVDSPSRIVKVTDFLHWMIINIPGKNVKMGETLAKYLAPLPAAGTGVHRFVFLIYEQPDVINMSSAEKLKYGVGELGMTFHIKQFVDEHRLGNATAGNFYYTGFDGNVGTIVGQASKLA